MAGGDSLSDGIAYFNLFVGIVIIEYLIFAGVASSSLLLMSDQLPDILLAPLQSFKPLDLHCSS
jgi:hypothetical protein